MFCACEPEYVCSVHDENSPWHKAGKAAQSAYAYTECGAYDPRWADLHNSAKAKWISLARDVIKAYNS
jgi:hypothetical protein